MHTVIRGHCSICEKDTTFEMRRPSAWRSLTCMECASASRNRALWLAISRACPGWREKAVHEGSPGYDIVSRRLAAECKNYTASQYDTGRELGSIVTETRLPCGKYSVQDFEKQTFDDEVFDLVVTQDVFEHIFNPASAIAEIARTLKPGGLTIMSVPVIRAFQPSRRRARITGGRVEHILEPIYHGNPVSGDGSLVTIDWGLDIAAQLSAASGMYFVMQTFENMDLGIRDEVNQILVGRKSPLPDIS
ncbi:class I SAM-dependent methyltransferase [Methylobacterium komagatae]|uniref:Class I SAM-dependent methyltransferase n=1 Tax=Methylobacterium komagatae TaxID=374425 RepID=A0ABW2BNN1_9HYPH